MNTVLNVDILIGFGMNDSANLIILLSLELLKLYAA
jgi:hypothetical protein